MGEDFLTRYDDNVDFYSMFEADTFSIEKNYGDTFVGLVEDEAGLLHIAGLFVQDADGEGGWGWWDKALV